MVNSKYQQKHFHKYRMKMVYGQARSTGPIISAEMDSEFHLI